MSKILLIDGNNCLWRVQKILPKLTTPDGVPVQVVYGFLKLLRGCLTQFEPDRVLVCWDKGKSVYRLALDPSYKHRRYQKELTREEKRSLQDTYRQMDVVRKLLKYLGVNQVQIQGVEADDLIGAACKILKSLRMSSAETTIVSADRDMLHLVSRDVSVWSPMRKELYTRKNFKRHFGMSPKQYLEVRALEGDKTDNIPGAAKGLGGKTAKDLITEFGTLEALYTVHARALVEGHSNRHALVYSKGARKRAELNYELMNLRRIFPKALLGEVEKCLWRELRVDKVYLKKFFLKHKFRSLLEDFGAWTAPFRSIGG